MNENALQHRKKAGAVFAACLGLWAAEATAQSGVAVFGNTHIGPGSELHVKDYTLTFQGGLTTQKTTPAGFVSFSSGAAHSNASSAAFADGFVRSYRTGLFTFPVGANGLYAPVTVTAANDTALDVAYNQASFNPENFTPTDITAVSETEYWDVLGANSGTVALSWQAVSALGTLAEATDELVIAGWNGTNWVSIPATLSEGATLTSGTLTTNTSVDFAVYSAFTFAKKYEEEGPISGIHENIAAKTYMSLQNGQFTLSANTGVQQVQLFDLTGKQVASYSVKGQSYQAGFVHAQGIYIAKAQLDNGNTVTRKLLNR